MPPTGTLSNTDTIQEMKLSNKEYAAINAQASNYRVILRFLQASGINGFLADRNLPQLDLMLTPDDTTGGESAILFLKAIADECNLMDRKITDLSTALVEASVKAAKLKREKQNREKSFFERVKSWIIEEKD